MNRPLTRNGRPCMTPDEETIVRRDYALLGPSELARRFGLSKSIIGVWANRHGLKCKMTIRRMPRGPIHVSPELVTFRAWCVKEGIDPDHWRERC